MPDRNAGQLSPPLPASSPRPATAAPFDWKFTRAKLNDLPKRIDAHRDRAGLPLAA